MGSHAAASESEGFTSQGWIPQLGSHAAASESEGFAS